MRPPSLHGWHLAPRSMSTMKPSVKDARGTGSGVRGAGLSDCYVDCGMLQ